MGSFVPSQACNNILFLRVKHWGRGGEGREFLDSAAQIPPGKLFSSPGVKQSPFPETENVGLFWTSYFQAKLAKFTPNFIRRNRICWLLPAWCQGQAKDDRGQLRLHTLLAVHHYCRDGRGMEAFVISISLLKSTICQQERFQMLSTTRLYPSIWFSFFPTFQYRISLTGLPLWLVFSMFLTFPIL